MKLFNKV